jgi:hypothetical protein
LRNQIPSFVFTEKILKITGSGPDTYGSSGKVGEKQIKFFLWEKRYEESIRK